MDAIPHTYQRAPDRWPGDQRPHRCTCGEILVSVVHPHVAVGRKGNRAVCYCGMPLAWVGHIRA